MFFREPILFHPSPPSLSLPQNVHVIYMSHGQILSIISCTGIRHGHWCWLSLCPQCRHSSASLALPSKLCHGHRCLRSVFFPLIPLLTIPLNGHTSIHFNVYAFINHSGSSIGGIIFPIMLNRLFKSSTGFQWGVRASAFIVLGMLLFANFLMKPRPHASTTERPKVNLRQIMTDIPYLITVFSWVWSLNIVLITSIMPCKIFCDKLGHLLSVCVFLFLEYIHI